MVIAEAEVAKFNLGLGTTTLSGEGLYSHPKGPGSAEDIEFISGFITGKTRPTQPKPPDGWWDCCKTTHRPLLHLVVLRAGVNSTVTLTDGVTDIPVLTYALGALNISTGTDWHPPQIVSGFSGLTLNTIHTHHRAQKSRATRLLSSRRRRSWACRCSPGLSTSFSSPTTRLMPVRHLFLPPPHYRDGYEWLDVHHLISTCVGQTLPWTS